MFSKYASPLSFRVSRGISVCKRGLLMQLWREANKELSAVFLARSRRGKRIAMLQHHFDHIFDDYPKLLHDSLFCVAVAALANQRRRAANETMVFVTPLDDLHIAVVCLAMSLFSWRLVSSIFCLTYFS
jgi:hypothetical protein